MLGWFWGPMYTVRRVAETSGDPVVERNLFEKPNARWEWVEVMEVEIAEGGVLLSVAFPSIHTLFFYADGRGWEEEEERSVPSDLSQELLGDCSTPWLNWWGVGGSRFCWGISRVYAWPAHSLISTAGE